MIERTIEAASETGMHLIETGDVQDYEIVVVDDASTDDTGAIAEKLAATDSRILVIHNEVNRKLGGTIRRGFAESRGDVILYTDADMPFDLVEVRKALRLMRVYNADIVSAYRFDRTGEGARRVLYSYCYNALVKLLLRVRLRDVNFAFKLLRREVLDHVELRSEGSLIDIELLAKAQRLGFYTIQFGVDYFPRSRGCSTLSSPAVIRRILAEMLALIPELRTLKPLPRPGGSRRDLGTGAIDAGALDG